MLRSKIGANTYIAAMQPERITRSKIFAYGLGIFGWSLSLNIISTLLSYIYLPPVDSSTTMVNLVPQTTVLVVFNIIALVMAAGRLFDALLDPLIANWSDRLQHRLGRRIPFMRTAPIFVAVFCSLMFLPPVHTASLENIKWLALVQMGYYFFFGLYVIPYNALLAELGHYPGGKMQLSTAQSVGFILGMVFSSSVPAMVGFLEFLKLPELQLYQYVIMGYNIIGACCMLVPAFVINEHRYVKPGHANEKVFRSLKGALAIRNFRIFAFADATFFMGIALIGAGLMYYVTTLLGLPKEEGVAFIAVQVVVTLLTYTIVNRLERRFSKKQLMIAAFSCLSLAFFSIYGLGKYPVHPYTQVAIIMSFFGFFNAFLLILPPTIVAEIAEKEAARTGENKEGMFFGMRALFQKIGQTLGVLVFMMLTLYGKDKDNDMGLRLTGVVGGLLCLVAALAYTKYEE